MQQNTRIHIIALYFRTGIKASQSELRLVRIIIFFCMCSEIDLISIFFIINSLGICTIQLHRSFELVI